MPPLPEVGAAKELRLKAFAELGHRSRESWSYAVPGFEAALAAILSGNVSPGPGDLIWNAKPKSVWKIVLPPEIGGDTVALKESESDRHYRYQFGPTPIAREAAHYLMLGKLGFPVVELLAVGDVRVGRRLKKSFIVTRYAEGFRDGRSFIAGGECSGDAELRDSFIREGIGQLARFHRMYFYHKGFKCYNLMWREAAPGRAELRLIDFASCRFRPKIIFAHHVVEDLAAFFDSLKFAPDEADAHLEYYRNRNPGCGLGLEALRRKVADRMFRRSK
ncbi:MAG: lipopolysaccharide kinase InaA family protein [Planctomycetota bacterium]|jgi:hypothetical protein|nr:lipopolysaccharide kinase InaA family protein [Planctomycetota bacterium]